MIDPDEAAAAGGAEATQDELLVAYLDGQLPSDESERLEARLADEPGIRERMQSLDRVWNALDALPRATASTAFTRSTVEMVAQSAGASPAATKSTRLRLPLVAVAAVAGLAVGAVLSLALTTAPERRALQELPVALHAGALENAGSVAFLERLAAETSPQLSAFRTEAIEADAAEWAEVSRMPIPERRMWIESLPSDELGEVSTRVDRFQDRLPAKREALQEFAQQLDRHQQSDTLRATALAYQAMVGRLTAGEQSELRQSDDDQRLRILQRSANRWARDAAMELSTREREAFRAAIGTLVESPEYTQIVERFGRFGPARDRLSRSPELLLLGATSRLARAPFGRPPGPPDEGARARDGSRRDSVRERFEDERAKRLDLIHQQWRSWFDTLSSALPERVQTALAAVDNDRERARMLEGLLREAVRDDLQDVFSELSPDEMQRVLLLPRSEFTATLSGEASDGLEGVFGPPPGGPGGGPPGEFGEGRRPGPPGSREGRDRDFPGEGPGFGGRRRPPPPRGGERPPRFSGE